MVSYLYKPQYLLCFLQHISTNTGKIVQWVYNIAQTNIRYRGRTEIDGGGEKKESYKLK